MTDQLPSEVSAAFGLWRHDGLHPLTTVLGYVQLLQRELLGPLTEQQQQAIENIRISTQRAVEVWHRTAAYLHAQYATPTPEPLRVSDLFDDVHRHLQLYGVRLTYTLPAPWLHIWGDHYLLAMALTYLLYPLDQLSYCTNTDLQLSSTLQAQDRLRMQVTSALRLQTDNQDIAAWLRYPGSCLNTAAIIIKHHGSTITTADTDQGVDFTFDLSISSS